MLTTITQFLTGHLTILMLVGFGLALSTRLLLYYAIKRQFWFMEEFEKRTFLILSKISKWEKSENPSFFTLLKNILQKTYYEIFELRERHNRRQHDKIMSFGDRIFFIQEGSARFIMDFLRQARYLRKNSLDRPKFTELAKSTISSNPVFSKLFGVIPVGTTNNVLNMLPSIFIICGIFGTFLGIITALPNLEGMDIENIRTSKTVMDSFLTKIAFAMNTSITGIMLSVLMSLTNTFLSPDNVFLKVITRFTSTVELLWNKSDHNDLSVDEIRFIDIRDTIEIDSNHALRLDGKIKWDEVVFADQDDELDDQSYSA